jgi:uncharacterized protein YdcH (DUF465 family)
MKRSTPWALALVPLLIAACGPGTVEVTTEVAFTDPESGEQVSRPIENLEIQLLPFDRDQLFDSLTAAAPSPEPGFPEELQVMQDSMFAVQETQRLAEAEWLALRERLQEITREMAQYSQAEAQYRVLFQEFNDLEARVNAAERRQNTAFEQLESMRGQVLGDLAEARIRQEQWEAEAFEDYPDILAERLREARRDILADTTDAMGQATFRPPTGEWWVHTRYQLPTEELYWNVRVNVERGDPLVVRLTRENAELRRVY